MRGRTLVYLLLVFATTSSSGCRATRGKQTLGPYFGDVQLASANHSEYDDDQLVGLLATAEDLYASEARPAKAMYVAEAAFSLAEHRQLANDPAAVDYFFQAACFCENALKRRLPNQTAERATDMYNSSIAQMLVAAQQHGRLSTDALTIMTPAGRLNVPLAHHGFAWQPEDFHRWYIVGNYRQGRLTNRFRRDGVGVPLVIVRNKVTDSPDDKYFRDHHAFAATVLLKGDVSIWINGVQGESQLHLYDPLRLQEVEFVGGVHPLQADISASLAYGKETAIWDPVQRYLFPDGDQPAKLMMLEPYQPGKIPIIFVHGLGSAPQAFLNAANELRADPEFSSRYQLWAFEYATGGPFLESAAALRQFLREAIQEFGGAEADPALGKIVVVGHSLGGLISKLLITESGDQIWNHVADVPLDRINTSAFVRQKLRRIFYFSPVAEVDRVVYIAVPFGGSPWADRLVGRIAARQVRFGEQEDEEYKTLLRDNPGAFHPKIRRRLPTSVELLSTSNPILEAMQQLSVHPQVGLHNIIGDGHFLLLNGPADGVVTVTSAQQPGVRSETYVDAKHTTILDHPETTLELKRILRR